MSYDGVRLEKEEAKSISSQLDSLAKDFISKAESFKTQLQAENWGGPAGELYASKFETACARYSVMASEVQRRSDNLSAGLAVWFEFDRDTKSTAEVTVETEW